MLCNNQYKNSALILNIIQLIEVLDIMLIDIIMKIHKLRVILFPIIFQKAL